MYVPEQWSDGDILAQFYEAVNSVQIPSLNEQEHKHKYKGICHHPSAPPRARIKKVAFTAQLPLIVRAGV